MTDEFQDFLKPPTLRERVSTFLGQWGVSVVIALVVVAAFAAPLAVIQETHDDTERILERLEHSVEEETERAIRVNVLTISCLLLIEPADRTEADLEACIRAGIEGSRETSP